MIEKNKVVTLDFAVTDDADRVLFDSAAKKPLRYVHGSRRVIPGLQKAVDGKSAGDSFSATVEPIDGYGDHSPELVYTTDLANFSGVNTIESGMTFTARDGKGSFKVTIVEVSGESVTVDANHFLAGQTLRFIGTVRDVRAASPEKIATGHVRAAFI